MAVTVTCPSCEQSLPVSDEVLGKKVRCKSCQGVFVAAAAKVKVGGKPENGTMGSHSPGRNGTSNGVHVKEKRPTPPPAQAAGNKKGLLIGGGAALLATAGVMVWALFLRGDGTSHNDPSKPNVPTPIINLTSTPTDKSTASDVATKTQTPANANTPTSPVSYSKKPMFAGFAESPKVIPAALSKDLLEKVMESAVMIRIQVDQGGAEGSGWFAEPGIIMTNSHVVGMLDPAAPPPHSIRVFLYMGQPGKQREITGKLLAIDRENDLAVISVKGHDNLPDPLPICPSSELFDGQQLHIMGFPLGSRFAQMATGGASEYERAATTLKVRNTSVSGRVFFKNGGAKYIQVEGGADHGNSGGAVFDNAGCVRSVLVAGISVSNMRFTIPSEYAVYLLQGRVLNVVPGQPYATGSAAKMPITAQVADPMRRIKNVRMEVWAGDPGTRIRPATDRQPSPLPGDSSRSTAELAYDAEAVVPLGSSRPATGEVDLPPIKSGQVYWVQPRYERIDGSTRWGEAIATEWSGLAVDRRSAHLSVKHESGSTRYMRMKSRVGQGAVAEGSSVQIRTREIRIAAKEQTRNIESDGSAKIRMSYTDVNIGDKDLADFERETNKELSTAAKGMTTEYMMTNRGLIKSATPNLQGVTREHRGILEQFNRQVIQSLESLELALPDKDVGAGETWGFNIPYTVFLPQNKKEETMYRLRFKYLGSRNRNGRDEGVVTFDGYVTKGDGSAATAGDASNIGETLEKIDENAERRKGVFGIIHGSALVDLQTGFTTLARTHADFLINFKAKVRVTDRNTGNEEEREIDATFGALTDATMQRDFKDNAPELVAEAFLPELPLSLNPFVGVPDGSVAAQPSAGNANSNAQGPGMTGVSPLRMSDEVRDRLKHQGCLIRAKGFDGGGDGSGWLAEPGIVVTNAHVVGMLDPAARPPVSLDVFFDSGTPQEKSFPAKILLVDHDNDLAVLELPTKEGLPEPMTIVPSTYGPDPLYESQRLSVIGFPKGVGIGSELGTTVDSLKVQIKMRDSSVAGRVENKRTKLLKYIQVEGGLFSGNSGGAIVDMNGNVRCVAVAVIPDSDTGRLGTLGLAIPSEYAARLLAGYPLKTEPQIPYTDGSVAKMPVEIKFGDPLRRVKKVRLDYWVGKPGLPRRSSNTAPKQRSDDSARQTVDCSYEPATMKALGEFVMPEVDPGFAYWVQPRYIDGTGKEVWGEAVFFAPEGRPAERRPLKLEAKFKAGGGQILELTTDAEYRYVYFGSNVADENHLIVTMAETYLGPNPGRRSQEMVTYKYENLSFGQPKSQNEYIKQMLRYINGPQLLVQIRNVISQTLYTKDGVMLPNPSVSFQGVDPRVVLLAKQFNDQVLQSIQTMSLKMPNKVVEYGETWEQPSNLLIQTRNRFEPALFALKLKYMGVRDRGGRSEAVIEIKGSIARDSKAKSVDVTELKTVPDGEDSARPGEQPKEKGGQPKEKDGGGSRGLLQRIQAMLPPSKTVGNKPLYGDVKGYAFIDVDSGHVSYCKMFIDIDVEVMHVDQQTKAKIPVRAGGTIEMELKRRTSIR